MYTRPGTSSSEICMHMCVCGVVLAVLVNISGRSYTQLIDHLRWWIVWSCLEQYQSDCRGRTVFYRKKKCFSRTSRCILGVDYRVGVVLESFPPLNATALSNIVVIYLMPPSVVRVYAPATTNIVLLCCFFTGQSNPQPIPCVPGSKTCGAKTNTIRKIKNSMAYIFSLRLAGLMSNARDGVYMGVLKCKWEERLRDTFYITCCEILALHNNYNPPHALRCKRH